MSWIFGVGKNQNTPDLSSLGLPPPPPDDGGKGGGKGGDKSSKMEAYRFDSAALERAAQAAKDLEKSSKYDSFI